VYAPVGAIVLLSALHGTAASPSLNNSSAVLLLFHHETRKKKYFLLTIDDDDEVKLKKFLHNISL
jgi:hypothetical protein